MIDCKVSINKLIIPNSYPLPIAQDLFAKLAGCKLFCALDLEGAYTQLELTDRSNQFMVINTLKGLYTYNERIKDSITVMYVTILITTPPPKISTQTTATGIFHARRPTFSLQTEYYWLQLRRNFQNPHGNAQRQI